VIFVAVGTSHFDSLIEQVDSIAPRLPEEVVMQIGTSRREPKNAAFFRFAPSLEEYFARASVVISHGGFGIMTEALERGLKVIAVENTDMFDNHQVELLEKFDAGGYVLWCRDLRDIESAIAEVDRRTFRPYTRPECHIGERIREFLGGITGPRR
jgi:beta-1,4-N-acetylglucosaminyltransferase